jgi:predicted DNA-binding transcriptional regulator AlpA
MSEVSTSNKHDHLIPDPEVCREFGICTMTLWRWDHDPALNFPPPIKIRTRKFRSRRLLEDFKTKLLHDAIAQRGAA